MRSCPCVWCWMRHSTPFKVALLVALIVADAWLASTTGVLR